jgi:1-acyl-sn-glycerol-3-phosphate acyltransferase
MPETGLTVMRALLGGWFLRRWQITEHGQEHVPAEGPVIIAANHLGWADGPLMFVKAPRKLHTLVKEEEFAGRHRHLLRTIGQIKVARNRVDAGALRRAAGALGAGQAIGIFPEGVRGDGELEQIKAGVAWLALVSGAPVVPLAIFGTRESGDGPDARPPDGAHIDLVYGRPVSLDRVPWPRTRSMIGDATEQIHSHLREHLIRARAASQRELPGPMPAGAWNV